VQNRYNPYNCENNQNKTVVNNNYKYMKKENHIFVVPMMRLELIERNESI